MSRFLPPAWFLSAGVVVLLVAACGTDNNQREVNVLRTQVAQLTEATPPPPPALTPPPTVTPDIVVGVVAKCRDAKGQSTLGGGCEARIRDPNGIPTDLGSGDYRYEVTVRTASATTYVVNVVFAFGLVAGQSPCNLSSDAFNPKNCNMKVHPPKPSIGDIWPPK